jgi:hypothetical protein
MAKVLERPLRAPTCRRSALEIYELELAFMVIAHSQRDPGEHMLQLQQFASQPEGPLRHHALDMHLGRWRHALSDLLEAGPEHFQPTLALAYDKVAFATPAHVICQCASV